MYELELVFLFTNWEDSKSPTSDAHSFEKSLALYDCCIFSSSYNGVLGWEGIGMIQVNCQSENLEWYNYHRLVKVEVLED